MKIICAWCRQVIGEKEPLEDDTVTHGICADCILKLDEYDERNADGT